MVRIHPTCILDGSVSKFTYLAIQESRTLRLMRVDFPRSGCSVGVIVRVYSQEFVADLECLRVRSPRGTDCAIWTYIPMSASNKHPLQGVVFQELGPGTERL